MLTPAMSFGSGLSAPEGVARSANWLAITDTANHQLVMLDVTAPAAAVRLGGKGTSPAAEGFLFPTAVAFTAPDQLYVADSRNRHLDHYAFANGSWTWQAAVDPFGSLVPAVGDVLDVAAVSPTSVLVLDSTGRVIAVDLAAGRASVALADARWKRVRAIAFAANRLYVADADEHVVYVYDASYTLTTTIGGFGPGRGKLRTPLGVAVDAGGNRLYVAQGVGGVVSAFDLSGTALDQLALPSDRAHALRRCAVDASGAIVIADAAANRAQGVDTSAAAAPATDVDSLSFGAVALGYSTVLSLEISNPTAGAVTAESFTVRGPAFVLDATSPAAPIVLSAGATASLLLRFAPLSQGITVGELLINTDSLAAPVLRVRLSGEGAGALPVAVGLILDTSGSMSQPGGALTKIERLHQAAALVADLLAPPGSNELSVTQFSSQAAVVAARAVLSSSNVQSDEQAINGLAAGGSTSIGAGLAASLGDLAATSLGRSALLVMTDGLENTPPMIADVQIPPTTRVYTVGLGLPQYVDADKLRALATVNGGYFQVTDGDDLLLNKFFVQVFGDIVGDDVAFDPPIVLHAGQPYRAEIDVTSSDHALTLALAWENATSAFGVELVTPAQQVIGLNRATWAVQRSRFVAARVDLRSGGAGQWIVRVDPTSVPAAGERVVLTVLAKSDEAITWAVQARGEKIAWAAPSGIVPSTEIPVFPDRLRPPVAPAGVRRGDTLRFTVEPTRPAHRARIVKAEVSVLPPVTSLSQLRATVANVDFDHIKEPPPKPLANREPKIMPFKISRGRQYGTADVRFDGPDGVYHVRLVCWLKNRFGQPFRRERSLAILVQP